MLTFWHDPGHGWLEVSAADLKDVGLTPHSFTAYSYRRGQSYFLEEDCDAATFIEAYRKKHGRLPDWTDNFKGEFVRALVPIHHPF